jgi:hypothetical protein
VDATALCTAFARELADLLSADGGAAALAAKTGLDDSTVQQMTVGESLDLFSWEMVSACATAAAASQESIVQLRELWMKAESARWAERGPGLLREIARQTEQARRQRRYHDKALSRRLFSEFRPSVPWRKTPGSGHADGRRQLEPWSCAQLLNKRRIPDPGHAMSLAEFYELLRQLHQWAGRPSYNEIEQRSWGVLSRTTAGYVLGGARWLQPQVRDLDNVRWLATVFGLPQTEVERWAKAYNRARELPPNAVPRVGAQEAVTDRPSGTRRLSLDPLAGTDQRAEQSPQTPGLVSLEPSHAGPVVKITARLRRWRITALCFAASTAVLGMAVALMAVALMAAAGNPSRTQSLQFPEKSRLFPGKPVRIPLKLAAGDWSLALHFRLESTEVASACVNDAQLSYVVEKGNGVDIASGRVTRGKSDSWTPAIRLDRLDTMDSPQVTVSVSVPSYDTGCGYTIDLSGSIIRG